MFVIISDICCGNSSVVERLLAKEEAAGSNPVSRSKYLRPLWGGSQGGHGTGLKNRRCGFDSHPPHH